MLLFLVSLLMTPADAPRLPYASVDMTASAAIGSASHIAPDKRGSIFGGPAAPISIAPRRGAAVGTLRPAPGDVAAPVGRCSSPGRFRLECFAWQDLGRLVGRGRGPNSVPADHDGQQAPLYEPLPAQADTSFGAVRPTSSWRLMMRSCAPLCNSKGILYPPLKEHFFTPTVRLRIPVPNLVTAK